MGESAMLPRSAHKATPSYGCGRPDTLESGDGHSVRRGEGSIRVESQSQRCNSTARELDGTAFPRMAHDADCNESHEFHDAHLSCAAAGSPVRIEFWSTARDGERESAAFGDGAPAGGIFVRSEV